MMNCPECGVKTIRDAQFCHQCGRSLQTGDSKFRSLSRSTSTDSQFPPRRSLLNDNDDERPLWEGTFSAKGMVGSWLAAALSTVALLAAGLLLPTTRQQWLGIAVVTGLAWLGLLSLLAWRKLNAHYELTDQRFIHKTGVLRRRTDRIEVIDMDDVSYDQGVVERLLGVGTIRVTSSDRTHPEIALRGIDGVQEVATMMDDARRRERLRRGLHIEAV